MTDPKFLQNELDKKLHHAMEECGEFIAASSKMMRWGAFSYNPNLAVFDQEFNIDWVMREAKDVQETMARLIEAMRQIDVYSADKNYRVQKLEETFPR